MLGKGAACSLEKGLSGTYDVPSGAAIAEKVHQLSLRCQLSAQIRVWPDMSNTFILIALLPLYDYMRMHATTDSCSYDASC